ncbi:MAG: hypothetical protein Q7U77_10260, partial [Sediminibacterium sp.]|nr:hypothetical protein [Sediminibacterium sp.]
KLVFQLFLGVMLGSLLQLVFPFLTQSVVDVGINTQNIQFVYIVLLAQLALFIGRLAYFDSKKHQFLKINNCIPLY